MRGPVGERVSGKRVIVCAGAGGVGKTTASAALACGLAARGARAVVVTIDPARRLAQALGVHELGNEPERLDSGALEAEGLPIRGELWAMMLDPKRTLDELVGSLSPDERSREEVLSNRIYRELSGAVAGSQEFSAMAKLHDLHRSGRFDVIVLDTPPSRNALEFLDAPGRMISFLEGRSVGAFLAPSGLASRVVGAGTGMTFSLLRRLTGADLLGDLRTFFGALSGLLGGFRERAAGTERLLRDEATTFLLVSSPEPEPVNEAIYFHEQIARAGMPFGGVIVNRVHDEALVDVDAAACASALAGTLGDSLARRVGSAVADLQVLSRRDRASVGRLAEELRDPSPTLVAELDHDVQELTGLVWVARRLFGE